MAGGENHSHRNDTALPHFLYAVQTVRASPRNTVLPVPKQHRASPYNTVLPVPKQHRHLRTTPF